MMGNGPCTNAASYLHIVIAVFGGLSSLLTIFLAHRRRLADKKRESFYEVVADYLGIPGSRWNGGTPKRRRVRAP